MLFLLDLYLNYCFMNAIVLKNQKSSQNQSYTDSMVLWFAQGLGIGRSPFAPGTVGTMLGVALYWFIADWPLIYYLALTATLFILGIPLCKKAANILEQNDPPSVVWDEIVGYLITMIALPPNWSNIIIGFILFRLFDIWKPWPIGTIDRKVHGGLGIMLDDLMAGLLAMPLVYLCFYIQWDY
jgi:phosphatidylglycerophosphatase A